MAERCTEIEKANKILLAKMTNILTASQKQLVAATAYKSNSNLYPGAAPKFGKIRHASVPPSLNKSQRQRESDRITAENTAMLNRLQDQKSNFDVYKWETARHEEIQRVKNICLYNAPLVKHKRIKSRRKTATQREKTPEPNRQLFNLIREISTNDMASTSQAIDMN